MIWLLFIKCVIFILYVSSIFTIGTKIEFTEEPLDTYGLENQQVVLRCSVHGGSDVGIDWFRVEKNISVDSVTERHSSNTVTSLLHFQLSKDSEDEYFCVASNGNSRKLSRKSIVKIAFLNESFILEPQDKICNLGETVLLECIPPIGLPVPQIEWIKNGVNLLPNDRLQIIDSGNLRINRATWNDTGEYICLAKSAAFRRQSVKAFLNVRQRPYFIVSPKSQSVLVYSALELFCRAAGEPNPMILWRREPSSLKIPYHRTLLLASGTLKFNSIQPNDAGMYVCRAVSTSGVVESIVHVNVVTPPGLISTSSSRVDVCEGCRVELKCNAVGSPIPSVRWFQWSNKKYFIENDGTDRIHVTKFGNLVITSARPEDSSTFECRVSSSVGLTRSLTYLKVNFNTELIPGRIGMVSLFNIQRIASDIYHPLRIICSVPKDPDFNQFLSKENKLIYNNFNVIWLKNGMIMPEIKLPNSRIFVEADGSLFFRSIMKSDQGNYTCSVYRILSKRYTQFHFYLTVKQNNSQFYFSNLYSVNDLPNPPSSVEVLSVGDTWISLKWLDSSLNNKYRFCVYFLPIIYPFRSGHPLYSEDVIENSVLKSSVNLALSDIRRLFNLDTWNLVFDNLYKTQVRITGLEPDTGYWIEIRTINENGMSYGCLIPHIIYTLKKPFQVVYSLFNNQTTRSDLIGNINNHFHSGDKSAVDFQELVSSFQSIELHSILLRSLTSTELMVSWDTRSANDILKRIDGFRLNVKLVPMSRCLSTVTSTTYKKSSSTDNIYSNFFEFHHWQKQNPTSVGSFHCSFASSRLLEQVLFMTNENILSSELALVSKSNYGKNASTPISLIVSTSYSLSRDKSNSIAVIGQLNPFTCYEVSIEAFKDDWTYGRIWSRSSRAEIGLTLDSAPSISPDLITAEWITDATFLTLNFSAALRLAWKSLDLDSAHGVILGYMIHLIANNSKFSRSVYVYHDVLNKDIHGLNPMMEYIIYISGVTCRGEGVRGPGFHLFPIKSLFDQKLNFVNSNLKQNQMNIPQWVYLLLFVIVIFWFVFGLCIYYFVRHGSRKNSLINHNDKSSHCVISISKSWSLFVCFLKTLFERTIFSKISTSSSVVFHHHKSNSINYSNNCDPFESVNFLHNKQQQQRMDLNQMNSSIGGLHRIYGSSQQDQKYNAISNQNHHNTSSSDLTFRSSTNSNHNNTYVQQSFIPVVDTYPIRAVNSDAYNNNNNTPILPVVFTNHYSNDQIGSSPKLSLYPVGSNKFYNVINNDHLLDIGQDIDFQSKASNPIQIPLPGSGFANQNHLNALNEVVNDDTVSAYASCSVFNSNQPELKQSFLVSNYGGFGNYNDPDCLDMKNLVFPNVNEFRV